MLLDYKTLSVVVRVENLILRRPFIRALYDMLNHHFNLSLNSFSKKKNLSLN